MKKNIVFFLFIILYCITVQAQELRIIYPKDGSYIQNGLEYGNLTLIKWSGNLRSEIYFEFSLDNGENWIPMNLYSSPNDTTGSWQLRDTTSEFF